MSLSLQDELQYFKENQTELLKQYEGKILVIQNKQIVGIYDSELEAYNEAQKKFELGTFLIQKCLPGVDSYTQTYYSRYAST